MPRTVNEHLAEKLKDSIFAQGYHALDLQFDIAEEVIGNRQRHGLTQAALAALVNTKQSAISRLENASALPSLSFLVRVADALDADVEVRIVTRHRDRN